MAARCAVAQQVQVPQAQEWGEAARGLAWVQGPWQPPPGCSGWGPQQRLLPVRAQVRGVAQELSGLAVV